jgi:hypothetical protein
MKIAFSLPHQHSVTAVENLRSLMVSMDVNSFSGVIVPEQERILYVLKEHEPEGLLTRELADRCGCQYIKPDIYSCR